MNAPSAINYPVAEWYVKLFLEKVTGEDWEVTQQQTGPLDWMLTCNCRGYIKRLHVNTNLMENINQIAGIYREQSASGEADKIREIRKGIAEKKCQP